MKVCEGFSTVVSAVMIFGVASSGASRLTKNIFNTYNCCRDEKNKVSKETIKKVSHIASIAFALCVGVMMTID